MRNGPGQYGMGSRELEHAFDGYAKPHNIRFTGDGSSKAYYTTKFIKSQYYLGEQKITRSQRTSFIVYIQIIEHPISLIDHFFH